MNAPTTYTDARCTVIAAEFGPSVATYADAHLAGWVLDLLADTRPIPRGPLAGLRTCDLAVERHVPEALLVDAPPVLTLTPYRDAHGPAVILAFTPRR